MRSTYQNAPGLPRLLDRHAALGWREGPGQDAAEASSKWTPVDRRRRELRDRHVQVGQVALGHRHENAVIPRSPPQQ